MSSKNKKDFLFVAGGQLASMVVSIVRSLILPLYLSIEDFGYFQSYLFYISLLPLITIGYNDGVYLRYGKFDYNDLPHRLLSTSNLIFTVVLFLLSATTCILVSSFINDSALKWVMLFSCSYSVFYGLNALILQIYQITQRFSEYTKVSVVSRLLSLCFILILIFFGYRGYYGIILADFLSFIIVTVYVLYINKQLFSIDGEGLSDGFTEYKECVIAGIPLLFAGLIGLLYFGGGRLIVQILGGIEQFASYSFSLSLASFVSIAISSLSTVVYPMITRYSEAELQYAYSQMNKYLRLSIIAVVPIYFIVSYAIVFIYPKYIDTLRYLSIVFAMTYLQSFIYVLQNTYYKTLRIEKKLLQDNVISIVLLFVIGTPIYYFTSDIVYVCLSTFIAILCRYTISIFRLKERLCVKNIFNYWELSVLLAFIVITTLYGYNSLSIAILTIILTVYVLANFKNIKGLLRK